MASQEESRPSASETRAMQRQAVEKAERTQGGLIQGGRHIDSWAAQYDGAHEHDQEPSWG